jgi:hypothetical protein
MPLDPALLDEIIAGFIAEAPVAPSDRLVRALAEAAGQDDATVRAAFEARYRAAGHESALMGDMPFSGSG